MTFFIFLAHKKLPYATEDFDNSPKACKQITISDLIVYL